MNDEHANPQPESTTATASGAIQISDLTVVAGDKDLLRDTSATFPGGKISLLVGPSGVGKSVLMKIVAGLIPADHEGIHYSGEVRLGEAPRRQGDFGVVFQSFALFDELSPTANVQFAMDHSRQPGDEAPADVLRSLNVPTDVRTVLLSGGQRQRLAIARALAYDPPAILFDEPTSGLDPENSRKVGELIEETQSQHGKTALIVTHDYESLVSIADAVFVLNPIDKQLEELPRQRWDELHDILQPMAAVAAQSADDVTREPFGQALLSATRKFMVGTGRGLENVLWGLISVVPVWKSFRWGVRYLAHYLRLVCGPTAWFYLMMAGIITGFVTTYYIFQFLPYARYTEPLLVDDLLSATGFSLYRIFVPILATVLIAARCGAAVTADVGSKQYSNQIDALRTFGVRPRQYLLSPIMISFLVGVPILVLIGFITARLTSVVTFTLSHPGHGPDYWYQHFHRGLHVVNQWWYHGSGWLLAKVSSCAVGIALISYHIGIQPKFSSNDVSRSVTATILWSTLYVLIVHFTFAFFEFNEQIKG